MMDGCEAGICDDEAGTPERWAVNWGKWTTGAAGGREDDGAVDEVVDVGGHGGTPFANEGALLDRNWTVGELEMLPLPEVAVGGTCNGAAPGTSPEVNCETAFSKVSIVSNDEINC
jgi:hypothetical protein